MSNYYNYFNPADPVATIMALDEETMEIFDLIDEDRFDPSYMKGFNDDDEEEYAGDAYLVGDFTDDDIGSLDIVDLDAEEYADADCEIEDFGEVIDAMMGFDSDEGIEDDPTNIENEE